MNKRTPPRKKALQLAKYLRSESPDYGYLRTVFMYLRQELEVVVTAQPKKLPYVPNEEEIQKYYDVIWKSKNIQDIIIIKVLIYTGIRVSELVRLKKPDVDLNGCQIRIIAGKGKKDRIVPFPKSFRETLSMYITSTTENIAKPL